MARGRLGTRRLVGALAGVALSALIATPVASAVALPKSLPAPTTDRQPPAIGTEVTVAQAIAWINAALSARSTQIGMLSNEVTASTTLTNLDRASAQGLLQNAATGIAELSQKVATATSRAAVHQDVVALIDDYHVFALLTPQITDAIAIDSLLAEARPLQQQETALQLGISAAQQSKRDVAAAVTASLDLTQRLDQTETLLSGLSASVLQMTAVAWASERSSLQAIATAIGKARVDLAAATQDENQIVRTLARVSSHTALHK